MAEPAPELALAQICSELVRLQDRIDAQRLLQFTPSSTGGGAPIPILQTPLVQPSYALPFMRADDARGGDPRATAALLERRPTVWHAVAPVMVALRASLLLVLAAGFVGAACGGKSVVETPGSGAVDGAGGTGNRGAQGGNGAMTGTGGAMVGSGGSEPVSGRGGSSSGAGGSGAPAIGGANAGAAENGGSASAGKGGAKGGMGGAPGGNGGEAGEASCDAVLPCGGDVNGTWAVVSSCLMVGGGIEVGRLGLGCSSSAVTGTLEVSGTWAADAKTRTVVDHTKTTGSELIDLNDECLNISGTAASCDHVTVPIRGMGYAAVDCATVSAGCACVANVEQSGGLGVPLISPTTMGTFSTAGDVLTISNGSDETEYTYCVSGSTLTLSPKTNPPTGTVTGTIVLMRQ